MNDLHLSIRYLVMRGCTYEESVEQNVRYVEKMWTLPVNQVAIILVDMWGTHSYLSHLARGKQIITEKVTATVAAAREAGVYIIHAPSPDVAWKYPQTTSYSTDKDREPQSIQSDSWPPDDFRTRTGLYHDYALTAPEDPPDVPEAEDIAEEIKPVASDYVVATGAQLHRLLKAKEILHLFYAGFATNECVRFRDYGMKNMRRMGYNTILLRDCTTAIENSYTVASEDMTKFSILDIERNSATTTVASFISACEQLDMKGKD